mgnify:CR=1 FL=1
MQPGIFRQLADLASQCYVWLISSRFRLQSTALEDSAQGAHQPQQLGRRMCRTDPGDPWPGPVITVIDLQLERRQSQAGRTFSKTCLLYTSDAADDASSV